MYDYEEELEWQEHQAEQAWYMEQQNQQYKAKLEERCLGKEYKKAIEELNKSGVKVLNIPKDIVVIPEVGFAGNRDIEEVILPDTVECIGKGAFSNCIGLKSIHFSRNLCRIGELAFYNCSELTTVYIPEKTKIDRFAFAGCTSLQEVIFIECEDMGQVPSFENTYYEYKDNEYCDRDDAFILSEYAFAYCYNLRRVEGMHLKKIRECAFLLCKNLEEITGSLLQEIKSLAFWGCDNLCRVVLNAGNEMQDPYFRMCRKINPEYEDSEDEQNNRSIEIGKYAFPYNEYEEFRIEGTFIKHLTDRDYDLYSCQTLQRLAKEIKEDAPWMNSDYPYNDWQDEREKSYADKDYDDMENDPDYWEDLYDKADREEAYRERLEQSEDWGRGYNTIVDPDVRENSLAECIVYDELPVIGFANSVHPDNLKKVKKIVFEDIEKVLGFHIVMGGGSVLASYKANFSYTGISSIDIPPNIEDLEGSFEECKNLQNIYFRNKNKNTKLLHTFRRCERLEHCLIPNGPMVLQSTFEDCRRLESVELGKDVFNIQRAFVGCKSLRAVTFKKGESLSITDSSFRNCISLREITLPEKTWIIGNGMFEGCINLREIVIPKNVKRIQSDAFKGCLLLESIIIEGCPKIQDESWIANCYNLKYIKAPKNLKDLKAPGIEIVYTQSCGHEQKDSFSEKKLETIAKRMHKYSCSFKEITQEKLDEIIQKINTEEKRLEEIRQYFLFDKIMPSNKKLFTIIDNLCDNVGKNKQEENVLVLPADYNEFNSDIPKYSMQITKLLWNYGKKACLEKEEQSVKICQGKKKIVYVIRYHSEHREFRIRRKDNPYYGESRFIHNVVEDYVRRNSMGNIH